MQVHITVDVEVWPVHPGGWPHTPLDSSCDCRREIAAYFYGECYEGCFGLPFQLETLRAHGLKATFFVDPMFSFALGIEPLRDVVALIQGAGQQVELHLHPEWLTDPRCHGLPDFRGPIIGEYPERAQQQLIEIGMNRMTEAGAQEVRAFRAGSWGARASTLRALRAAGLELDSSLNAHYAHSFYDVADRLALQSPTRLGGITEVPITRFNDGVTRHGRPLSIVGVSVPEMKHVLDSLQQAGASSVSLVLHSNEFVKTENLWKNRQVVPRRWIARRFEELCSHLAGNLHRFQTDFVAQHLSHGEARTGDDVLVRTGMFRTLGRLVGQAVSSWY